MQFAGTKLNATNSLD